MRCEPDNRLFFTLNRVSNVHKTFICTKLCNTKQIYGRHNPILGEKFYGDLVVIGNYYKLILTEHVSASYKAKIHTIISKTAICSFIKSLLWTARQTDGHRLNTQTCLSRCFYRFSLRSGTN